LDLNQRPSGYESDFVRRLFSNFCVFIRLEAGLCEMPGFCISHIAEKRRNFRVRIC
jgi:hypothetical protein